MKKRLFFTMLVLGGSCPLLQAGIGFNAVLKKVTFENKTADTIEISFEDMQKTEDLTEIILKPKQKVSRELTGKPLMTKLGKKAKFIRFIGVRRKGAKSKSEHLPTLPLILDQRKSDDKKELNKINSKINKQKQARFIIGKHVINDEKGEATFFAYSIH